MHKIIIDKALKLFASPVLLHYCLPVLMLCLIVGTIAQKYIGLYEATKIFFASPFIWLGPLPLPGLPIVLLLISLNLAGKLIFKSPWTLRNSGIIITHIGALMLLVGGLITACFSTEGYIDIPVGKASNTITDYHSREFILNYADGSTAFSSEFEKLNKGQIIEPYNAKPVKLEITDICRNCKIEKRTDADDTFHSMAKFMRLVPDKLKPSDEENMGGITLKVSGAEKQEENGTYVVLEDIPKHPEIHTPNALITIELRKAQRELPFTIELLDFKREVYPGTQKPKSYESRVRILDNGLQWESSISMNAPLRYKGYTFFQSSYISTPDGDVSVLAAVWNIGRTFPYIASLTMGLGILIHLLMRGRRQ